MPLSEQEKLSLERLEERFSGYDSFVINRQSGSVFGVTHHPELEEEDQRYEYEGKLDDTPPGNRLHLLGTVEEYILYNDLRKRANE